MKTVKLVIVTFKAAAGAGLFAENVARAFAPLDAVLITRESVDEVTITETMDLDASEGAALGVLSGALVGLLAGPLGGLVGAAAGAVTGAATASQIDVGVPNDMIDMVAKQLTPHTSAYVALIQPDDVEVVQETVRQQSQLSEITLSESTLAWETAEQMATAARRKPKLKTKRKRGHP